MSDVTRILQAAQQGDPRAAEELLPLVYDQLRRLAAARMAGEMAGRTLQPTALVHEAWLRLVGNQDKKWDGRAHFFGAAAEAMRRILIDRARRKCAVRHGGSHLCANGKFPTADGKAHFKAVELPEVGASRSDVRSAQRADPAFKVTTRRGKQFNSLIYAEVDPLNGAPRDAVLMNAEDAATLHLMHGDRIALTNDIGRYEGKVFLAPLAQGNLQIHWPEGNVIIRRGITDPAAGVPAYKANVTVEKIP